MQNQVVTAIIYSLSLQLPSLILWSVGIAISLYLRPQNPRKFLLTSISFLIFFLLDLVSPIFSVWSVTYYAEHGFSATQMAFYSGAFSLVTTSFWIGSWVILFVALFKQKYNSVGTTLPD